MNFKKIVLLCFGLVIFNPFYGFSQQKYPKPKDFVSDFAGILDANSKQQMINIARELEQKISAEIAVVTIKSLGDETIEGLAVSLFEQWGIGKKDKDNGILFITSIQDRKIRIEVGYGLEGILPDGKVGEILDNYVIPSFRENNYSQGLTLGVLAIATVIAKDAGAQLTGEMLPIEPAKKKSIFSVVFRLLFLIIMFFLFIRHPFLFLLFLGGGRGGGFGGGGFGGGFGGFGGGMSGGGGASRGW